MVDADESLGFCAEESPDQFSISLLLAHELLPGLSLFSAGLQEIEPEGQ